jgi:HEAT repeat protein
LRAAPDDLDVLIHEVRSLDPLVYEGAYLRLLPHARGLAARLVQELASSLDPLTRGKLIELLGESRDPAVVPCLVQELVHQDQNVRQWAVTALVRIGTPESLSAAEGYRSSHPAEFA